jgi:hypothetical protein
MKWLKNVNDDIYDPTYTDMLRVAFTSEFSRGKLQDLVALLSGRNFETKQYEAAIAEDSFGRLSRGVKAFISQTHFDRITMIVRSAGFVTSSLIGAQNNVNFAYILYLRGRAEEMAAAELERLVRRWYVMSVVTRRYSKGNPETDIDYDIRQIAEGGLTKYCEAVLDSELSDNFWTNLVPIELDTSSVNSPFFKGFLSRDITVNDLLLNRSDVHHVYPKKHLKDQGLTRGRYNQIANFVLAQSEINIAIGDKPPEKYFAHLAEQCEGGTSRYGGITKKAEMRASLKMHCIPESMLDGDIPPYDDFLEQRRQLMAAKIREWYQSL